MKLPISGPYRDIRHGPPAGVDGAVRTACGGWSDPSMADGTYTKTRPEIPQAAAKWSPRTPPRTGRPTSPYEQSVRLPAPVARFPTSTAFPKRHQHNTA